jgi:hypothetical protein
MSNVFNDQVVFNNGTQTYGNSSVSGDLEVAGTIRGGFIELPSGEAFSLDETLRSGNVSGIGISVGISTFTSINTSGISVGIATITTSLTTSATITSAGIASAGITSATIASAGITSATITSAGITTTGITTAYVTNLRGVGTGTSVRIPTGNSLVGLDVGSIYAPGMIVQTVYLRSDTRTTYASNNSGNGTTVSALEMTIVPKNANNRIIVQWMVNGELHQDNVFLIHRDGALITTAGEEGRNSVSNNRWSGYASAFYDQNESSTPSNWVIMYSQIAGSTASRTYAPAVRGSGGSNYTFYLNRTISSDGADNNENMVSSGVIFEVAV